MSLITFYYIGTSLFLLPGEEQLRQVTNSWGYVLKGMCPFGLFKLAILTLILSTFLVERIFVSGVWRNLFMFKVSPSFVFFTCLLIFEMIMGISCSTYITSFASISFWGKWGFSLQCALSILASIPFEVGYERVWYVLSTRTLNMCSILRSFCKYKCCCERTMMPLKWFQVFYSGTFESFEDVLLNLSSR